MFQLNSEELWNAYNAKLKSYIGRKVSDEYEAEDIFQEIYLCVIKNESKIENLKNVEAWLYTIARNKIFDYYRTKGRFTYMDDIDTVKNKDFYTNELDNFNSEAASCLLKMTQFLPESYKVAIIECDYNGIQQNVLGEKLGLSYSGTKNRVQRARKKLREAMLNCCEVKSDKQGNIIELVNKNVTNEELSCINC